MSLAKKHLGQQAERLIADYLSLRGFQIITTNVQLGRLEIDLIAENDEVIVFCEVRSRAGTLVHPAETFDKKKRARIRHAAARWLYSQPRRYKNVRFDAAAVRFEKERALIDYYENAF